MKKVLIIILLLSMYVHAKKPLLNSVVEVLVTTAIPSYKYPYQASRISSAVGSGVIISQNRILTSAHVVSDAKLVEIKKENDPKRYMATVTYISHQSDLAILKLKDKSFFLDTYPLKLNESIENGEEVAVMGYPVGGNALSVTTGIVSRIEYVKYVWSSTNLLAIQIDAAINDGNSGGAVVNNNNELIGIAMMTLEDRSNIGYIVPAIVINTFLEDIQDTVVDGFQSDDISFQAIDNDAVKNFYGLDNQGGILVVHVGVDEQLLKVNDILFEIDGKNIANNGSIQTKYGRVNFMMQFHTKQLGQTVKLKVFRNKKELTVKYTLNRTTPLINEEFNKEPRYIIYAGFIFTPLTKNYIKDFGLANDLKMLLHDKYKTIDYEEPIVVTSTIFPNKVNRGYRTDVFILTKVNGIKIKNFKHFVSVLDNIKDEFTVFDFLEKRKIILNTKDSKDSLQTVLDVYNLKSAKRE